MAHSSLRLRPECHIRYEMRKSAGAERIGAGRTALRHGTRAKPRPDGGHDRLKKSDRTGAQGTSGDFVAHAGLPGLGHDRAHRLQRLTRTMPGRRLPEGESGHGPSLMRLQQRAAGERERQDRQPPHAPAR